jgi:hypothetical protein
VIVVRNSDQSEISHISAFLRCQPEQ